MLDYLYDIVGDTFQFVLEVALPVMAMVFFVFLPFAVVLSFVMFKFVYPLLESWLK